MNEIQIAGAIHSVKAEAVLNCLKKQGRGFASYREAWADLKLRHEQLKPGLKSLEDMLKEMWSAVKENNEDAAAAYSQNIESTAAQLACDLLYLAAAAKISADGLKPPEDTEKNEGEGEEKLLESICDSRCRWMRECAYQDELDEHCAVCGLVLGGDLEKN